MKLQNSDNDKYGLSEKYGPLLTLPQVAEVFHRSREGLRVSLNQNNELSKTLNKAKKKFGGRVYFKAFDISEIIDNL